MGYINNSNGPMFMLSSATTPLSRSSGHVERFGTVLRIFLDQSLLPEVKCTWKEEYTSVSCLAQERLNASQQRTA